MKTIEAYAVITGASCGFGRAITLELATRRKNVLLLSLKGEGLKEFCEYVIAHYNIKAECLEVDFLDSNSFSLIKKWLNGFSIDMLVNNVGIGGSKLFEEVGLAYIDNIIQINVRSTALLTHLLIPELKSHSNAYILNVASMAAFSPIAYKTVYPASKAFIYSFSRSLGEELKDTGISVSVVFPGPMRTNIDITRRIKIQNWWVKAGLQTPEITASIAIKRLYKKHRVIIPGFINKINWLLMKVVPPCILIPIVSKAVKQEVLDEKRKKNPIDKTTITASVAKRVVN